MIGVGLSIGIGDGGASANWPYTDGTIYSTPTRFRQGKTLSPLVDEIDHCAPVWMLEDDVKDTRAATWRPPAKEIASERDRAPEW